MDPTVSTSTQSWPVTMFLAWILGIFGVHRFYTGHVKVGILYLFTCGGCGIGVLIDWIMLWTNSYRDSSGSHLMSVPSGGVRAAVAAGMLLFGMVGSAVTGGMDGGTTSGRSSDSSCHQMCRCSFNANYKMASSIDECADVCSTLGPMTPPIHPSCM